MIDILHRNENVPTAVYVTRETKVAEVEDQDLLALFCTGTLIQGWESITAGSACLRNVSATRVPPITAAQLERQTLIPIMTPAVFSRGVQIFEDEENDAIADVGRKVIRPGLWVSPLLAGCDHVIGHAEMVYWVPGEAGEGLLDRLANEGVSALAAFESFRDPTSVAESSGVTVGGDEACQGLGAPRPTEAEPVADGEFLMPIEDWFVITGTGTVVTGCVRQGVVHVGDSVVLQGGPAPIPTVVNSIQTFRKPVDAGRAGDHIGLALRDVSKDQLQGGMVMTSLVRQSDDVSRACRPEPLPATPPACPEPPPAVPPACSEPQPAVPPACSEKQPEVPLGCADVDEAVICSGLAVVSFVSAFIWLRHGTWHWVLLGFGAWMLLVALRNARHVKQHRKQGGGRGPSPYPIMACFIFYCTTFVGFWVMGSTWLALGWFWNAVFSLLASGAVTLAARRVTMSRLAPGRVKAALDKAKAALTPAEKSQEIRAVIEDAFGVAPESNSVANAGMAAFLAYIPLAIVLCSLLGLALSSVFWCVAWGSLLAIPCSGVLGMLASRAAAQEAMFKEVEDLVTERPEVSWRRMMEIWRKRRRAATTNTKRKHKKKGKAKAKASRKEHAGRADVISIFRELNPNAAIAVYTEQAASDLPSFPELDSVARKIVNIETNRDYSQTAGLEAHEARVRSMGITVNSSHGLEGMQYVWKAVRARKGRRLAKKLSRIWDGVGEWRARTRSAPPRRSVALAGKCAQCGTNASAGWACPSCRQAYCASCVGSPMGDESHADQLKASFEALSGMQVNMLDLTGDGKKPTCPRCGRPLSKISATGKGSRGGSFAGLDRYADTIAAKVRNTDPCQAAGLYDHETAIRKLGQEINASHDFKGMQYVWRAVKDLKGPGATSELTRIWNGVGRWQA